MAPMYRQLRRALGAVKDQTSIGLARVGSAAAPDLDVALVKATSHDEAPVEEKYIQEILHLTSFSRLYVSACVSGIARRLSRTHNWIVAIKALMLVHRLLRDGGPSFKHELLHASRQGMRVLNLSDFRDDSHSNGWDYSAFVRTYALFLDECVHCDAKAVEIEYESHDGDYAYGNNDENRRHEEASKHLATKDMKPRELLDKVPSLQRLLERVLACRPTGAAKFHRLVHFALYPIVQESFQIYSDICDGLAILLDAFFEMEHRECMEAFEIYLRGSKQADELASFYTFCKNMGVCRPSEYPAVQKIPEQLLETLEDFLKDHSGPSSYARTQARLETNSPETQNQPEQENVALEDSGYEINEIRALPAPPVELPIPEPESASIEKGDSEADLLNFDKVMISSEEHGDKLALALFSGTDSNVQRSWEAFPSAKERHPVEANGDNSLPQVLSEKENKAADWELALVATASQLSKSSSSMAGGFDPFLLDSMYDQAVERRKHFSTLVSGSASSVALPGRPASSFLALPAPVAQNGEEDPFAASLGIPPPSYVQMDDVRKKQQLLAEEQKFWLHYERDGMQGCTGLYKLYNNPDLFCFQNAYAVPYHIGWYAPYY